MKRLLVLSLLGAFLSTASAFDLTGTWRLDLEREGGVKLHTFFVLRQQGEKLDGKVVINESADLELRKPHQEGDEMVFSVDWNTEYRLRPEGKKLHVTLIYGGKDREEAMAVPADESETKTPAPLPLPAIEDLPYNGLAKTPPMGWNSWNHFGSAVSDKVVRETAAAMAVNGMAAAGYVYVNIDDTWEKGRDAEGNIVPNAKFPDMKALADYVHGLGLKLGIYSSPGPVTCGGYPGSYGHEEQDAKTYAKWGIDYLKYDWCSAGRIYPNSALRAGYQKMGRALQASGRDIVYSACEYGMEDFWVWGAKTGANLWRTTGDIEDNWASMSKIGFNQGRLAPFAGPGHWNDPDMLEVGNGGMTPDEYRTHFSLWCLLAAPLMAGNDLRSMKPEILEILTNKEAIALDQDPLGRQGQGTLVKDAVEVWIKPLQDGGLAIGFFNRGETEQSVHFNWTELGLAMSPASVRDLWLHQELPSGRDAVTGRVPKHGVILLRVK